jgi:hypothetical protein
VGRSLLGLARFCVGCASEALFNKNGIVKTLRSVVEGCSWIQAGLEREEREYVQGLASLGSRSA